MAARPKVYGRGVKIVVHAPLDNRGVEDSGRRSHLRKYLGIKISRGLHFGLEIT